MEIELSRILELMDEHPENPPVGMELALYELIQERLRKRLVKEI